MVEIVITLLCCAYLDDGPPAAHYVRLDKGRWVLESEVTEAKNKTGTLYQSVTHRPGVKMTLKVFQNGRPVWAETMLETGGDKKTAKVAFDKGAARLQSGGTEKAFVLKDRPVVTTAPDWSDIFLLVRRYDGNRGGRQEFVGFWFHPTQEARVLTFTVEKLGEDKVTVKDRPETLSRYRVALRSGPYVVWADRAGRVWKLQPAGNAKAAVVLEGHETATADLK